MSSSETAVNASPSPADAGAPSTPPAQPNVVFWGPNGLRAGWRVALYFILIFLTGTALRFGLRPVFHALHITSASYGNEPWFQAIQRAVLFLTVLIPAVLLGKWERRPLRAYGLGRKDFFGARFWEGALWGFVALTAVLVLMRISGVYWFGPVHFDLHSTLYYGSMWALMFIFVGLSEEFLFRGYLQFTLTGGMGFWPATVVTSLLFFTAHAFNPGENILGLVDVFLSGIVCVVMLWRTGNLWFAIGAHFGWDWAQSFFYGVPDSGFVTQGHLLEGQSHGTTWLSGGTVGPEGSIYAALIELVLIALVIWRFPEPSYPEKQYIPRQPDSLF